MTGFTIERRNYVRLLNNGDYATVDAMPPNDMSARGLASKLFKDMLDNGFKLIWSDNETTSGDSTLLHAATKVVFEPTTKVDPLSPSVGPAGSPAVVAKPQGYRIGFIVDGSNSNQLIAYLGTSKTMGTTGIKVEYSYPVVLLQGGDQPGETRINEFNEYGYRISITNRGFVIICWAPRYIENMEHMGMLCVQRPVKYDGSTLVDGYAPVFAFHNTDPIGSSRPVLTDRFFKVLLREKDGDLPSMATLRSTAANRHATGSIKFTDLSITDPTGTCGANPRIPNQIQQNVVINGHTIQLGSGKLKSGTTLYDPSHTNNTYVSPALGATATKDQLVNAFMTAVSTSQDKRLAGLNFIGEPTKGLVHIIAKDPGDLTISYSAPNPVAHGDCKETVAALFTAPVLSPVGTLAGGGRGWKPYSGVLTTGNSLIDELDSGLVIGPVTFNFMEVPSVSPPANTAEIALPASGTMSTNQYNSLIIDNIITWLNSNRARYPEFGGVEYYKTGNGSDSSLWNKLVIEKDPRISGSDAFLFQKGPTGTLTIEKTTGGALTNDFLMGGLDNQAKGRIVFTAVPNDGCTLIINGGDAANTFIFRDSTYVGYNEISTVVDYSSPTYLEDFVARVAAALRANTASSVQEAHYWNEGTTLRVKYKQPGYIGNSFSMSAYGWTDPVNPAFSFPDGLTLTGGAGSANPDGSTTTGVADEVSEQSGIFGTSMYRVPNVWEGPVTTDTGEYVLLFPFGFCSEKVAFTEEMDLVAISKGAAYQGIQDVSVNVYGQARTYTSYNSNLSTQKDYVRIFVLTGGGDLP